MEKLEQDSRSKRNRENVSPGTEVSDEQQGKMESTKKRNYLVDLRKIHQQECEFAIETALPLYLYSEKHNIFFLAVKISVY